MPANWLPLLWMAAAALALWPVQRMLHRHIQGLALLLSGDADLSSLAHFVVLLPGIVVHELSHWLSAKLLGVRVGRLSIGPMRKRGQQMRYGSVQIARADPVRESLIGLAPLVAGTALVLLLARWGFGLLPSEHLAPAAWPARIMACLRAADAWLWIYLIFAVSNTMLPSAADRRPWRILALYLAAVLGLAYALIGIPRGSEVWMAWGLRLASYLAYAFTLTTVVDLGVLALLLPLEWATGQLTGRRVEYDAARRGR